MSTESVLVVDDEPDIREGIILLNKNPNRFFESACNGLEALEMLCSKKFDIVVSDISMPKMTGTDLIKAAREKGIQIPFIFISGLSDSNVNHKLENCTDWHLIEKTDIKKLEIKLEYDESILNNKFVFGSSVQLSQVFINLITNACHAVEHLEERWIKIQLKESDSFYEIVVSNSGPQIPEEIQEKIFQPFFTTKDPGKGTGLGLSLSKNIIEMHKGHLALDLNSANPRFSIQLPKN